MEHSDFQSNMFRIEQIFGTPHFCCELAKFSGLVWFLEWNPVITCFESRLFAMLNQDKYGVCKNVISSTEVFNLSEY